MFHLFSQEIFRIHRNQVSIAEKLFNVSLMQDWTIQKVQYNLILHRVDCLFFNESVCCLLLKACHCHLTATLISLSTNKREYGNALIYMKISTFVISVVAYDWVRNCSSIADFYYSMEKHNSCALALASAEKVLTEKVFSKIKIAENAGIFNVSLEDCVELEAEINKKWAKLDVKIMRTAFDIQAAKKHALESGEHWEDPVICDGNDGIEQSTSGIVCAIDVDESGDEIKNTKTNLSGELKIDQDNATSAIHCAAQKSSFIFVGCPVQSVTLLRLGEISNFESARIVFLRASARIEEAKKKYLLEGAKNVLLSVCFLIDEIWNMGNCVFVKYGQNYAEM